MSVLPWSLCTVLSGLAEVAYLRLRAETMPEVLYFTRLGSRQLFTGGGPILKGGATVHPRDFSRLTPFLGAEIAAEVFVCGCLLASTFSPQGWQLLTW